MINPSTSSLDSSSVEMSTVNSSKSSVDNSEGIVVSDDSLKKSIWGSMYRIFQLTGLVLYISPEDIKTTKGLLHLIPNALASVILLANAIYCLVRMSNVPFSINWVYSNCLFMLSLHGAVSSLVMMGYKYNNYFSTVITLLRKATRNNFHISPKLNFRKVFGIISFVVMMTSMVIYCVDNYILFPATVTLPESLNVPSNDTQFFRKSMFGYQPLFALDTIIKLYSMLVSASCLFIYICANGATCTEFDHFNSELRTKISDKSILKLEVIELFESQLTDFLTLIKYVTENAVGVISLTFIAGVILNICCYYAHRAFHDYLMFGNVTFGFWMAVSVTFLILSCLRVGSFHLSLRETNDILHLSHEIQKDVSDNRIKEIVRDMISRINDVDYGVKNMFPIQFGMVTFHILMLTIPFFMEFFVNNKHIPDFLIQVVGQI